MSDQNPEILYNDPEDEDIEEVETDIDPLVGVDIVNDVNLPDPAAVITVRTSGNATRYVPAQEGMTVGEAILQSGIPTNGSIQIWMNGVQMKTTDIVPGGSTLTVLTSVKGG